MKSTFFLIFLLLIIIKSKKENKISFPNDQIYELIDSTFDSHIKNGENYRWFILFYLSTCGHCARAKEEISKIYQNYNKTKIRFAEIEIQDNIMTSVRFNVSGVPFIVLVENNSIFELQKYPNENNLIEFLNTSFNDVKDELVIFPKKVSFAYVAFVMSTQQLQGIADYFSEFISNYTGKQITIKVFHLIILGILSLVLLGLFEYWLLSRCCGNDEQFEKELEKLLKERREKNQKENKEKNEGENNNNNDKNDNGNKENSESKEGNQESDKNMSEEEKKIEDEKKKEIELEDKEKKNEDNKEENKKKKKKKD
jgi:thiol-disulfide isomerase/thioredoxin